MIAIWDVQKSNDPVVKFEEAHVENINDIRFAMHPSQSENMLISTSDDGHFKIWDIRKPTNEFVMAYKDSEDSLCIGQFNPINQHIFAVAGDSAGQIEVWDMRMP